MNKIKLIKTMSLNTIHDKSTEMKNLNIITKNFSKTFNPKLHIKVILCLCSVWLICMNDCI